MERRENTKAVIPPKKKKNAKGVKSKEMERVTEKRNAKPAPKCRPSVGNVNSRDSTLRSCESGQVVYKLNHRFFAAPMCVPCTLLPNSKLLLLSCQCTARGDRCSIMSVRLDLPLAAVPPREDWRR